MDQPTHSLHRLVEHLFEDGMETELRLVAQDSEGSILTLVAGIDPSVRHHYLVGIVGQIGFTPADQWLAEQLSNPDIKFPF